MGADRHATVTYEVLAGLPTQAAAVAVAEWPNLSGPGGDYCLDRLTRTVADTLSALVDGDVDRARQLIDLAEDQYLDGFVRGLVLTHKHPFADKVEP